MLAFLGFYSFFIAISTLLVLIVTSFLDTPDNAAPYGSNRNMVWILHFLAVIATILVLRP